MLWEFVQMLALGASAGFSYRTAYALRRLEAVVNGPLHDQFISVESTAWKAKRMGMDFDRWAEDQKEITKIHNDAIANHRAHLNSLMGTVSMLRVDIKGLRGDHEFLKRNSFQDFVKKPSEAESVGDFVAPHLISSDDNPGDPE